jgi:DNA-binding response OmpR family regulator
VRIIRIFIEIVVAGRGRGDNGIVTMMLRILLVEDEERLARRLARVLGGEGYTAETVGDGRSALGRSLAEPFDLLIVDWMLPDLDGIQVMRRLRAGEISVLILMLTPRGQIEDRVTGLDAGADDYLPKPFAITELLARVCALSRWPREEKITDSVHSSGLLMSVRRLNCDSGKPDLWSNGSVFMGPREYISIDPSPHIPLQQTTVRAGDVSLDPLRHAVWRGEERVDLFRRFLAGI